LARIKAGVGKWWSNGNCKDRILNNRKKLVEVALPLEAINKASAREKLEMFPTLLYPAKPLRCSAGTAKLTNRSVQLSLSNPSFFSLGRPQITFKDFGSS
jgi:hypothetical protein